MRDTCSAVIDGINCAGVIHWNFASTMFVQVVALVAILALAELCLRRRVRPVVRYWLWALVVLKLMLPVSLRTPASLGYWVRSESQPVATTPIPAADPDSTPRRIGNEAPQEFGTRPPEELAKPAFVDDSPKVAALQTAEGPSIRSDRAPAAVAAVQPALPAVSVAGWLFLAWCGGCLELGGIVFRRAAKVRRLVHGATEATRDFAAPLEVACSPLQLSSSRVRVKISEQVGCPAVCGLWRPTILMPARLVGKLDEEQLQLIFVHELAHWKRWDLQLNLLQTVLQVVYFYNPAVWVANAVLRRLREEAVDDAVLVAMAAPAERYSQTLLEVAAQTLRPVEAGVPLIGILESRRALVRRIYRLTIEPLPRSARLGLGGFVVVAIIAVALLPMAGGPRVEKKVLPTEDAERLERSVALRGRITDETGKPLGDARIQLVAKSNKRVREVRTAADGTYTFQRPARPGRYAVLIERDGYLGYFDPNDAPIVTLDAKKQSVRIFSLSQACRLRVQTVDEGGRPIAGVHLVTAGRAKIDPKGTGADGWITIEGMRPTAYVLAAGRDDLATTRLDVTIESPNQVVERRIVLKGGTRVRGKLVSWDGKPAAGWEVVAVPTWWSFPEKPRGQTVRPDGTFLLPEVGPGKYNVSLVVPTGTGSRFSMPLVAGVELSKRTEPLSLRADLPSPGWQGAIDGTVRYVGRTPKLPIGVYAQSLENDRFRQEAVIRDAFRLGSLPPGRYRLTFQSAEVQTKSVEVVAPAAGVQVDIEANSPIPIHGVVSVAGAKSPEPLRDLRVRVWKYPGGDPAADEEWQPIDNHKGEFNTALPGPGAYIVEAVADGYALARSEPIGSDHLSKEGVNLTLAKIVRLSGTVVDESGRPIDGAIVNSLAKAHGSLRGPNAIPIRGTFAKTVAGRFEFNDLPAGLDTLRIDHRNYASAVEKVKLPRDGDQPLQIVMKRGATIRGHVLDETGMPVQDVKLQVWCNQTAFSGVCELGTVSTDANGAYEIHGLPEQLIEIRKLGGGGAGRGVFFKRIVPSNSKPRTVDFGGPPKLSGRLFVDGNPFVGSLMLSAEEYHGAFAAQTTTDADGAFAFSGVPLGQHYLFAAGSYRDEWIRIREVEMHSAEQSLGRIDFGRARLTVNVAGILQGQREEDVYLYDYNPTPFPRRYVARPNPRKRGSREFVFDVGFGKYDLVANAGPVRLHQVIEITPNDLNPATTITWPEGTASLEGTLDPKLTEMSDNTYVTLASRDERWSERIYVHDGGRYRFAGIPAGRYSLSLMPVRLTTFVPVLVAEVTFHEGEARTLDITKATIPHDEFAKGVLTVDTYTSDGVPLLGAEITLLGAKGAMKRQFSRGEHSFFVAPTGVYHLTAVYAGLKTVTHTVEIKPVLENTTWKAVDQAVQVTLARDE